MKRRTPVSVVLIAVAAIAATALVALTHRPPAAAADDPLGPELRARVERLLAEAAQVSSDPKVLGARLDTLWEWGNALAVAGAVIPVDFPYNYGICRSALLGRPWDLPAPDYAQALVGSDGRVSLEKVSQQIAGYARELEIKGSRPGAIGTLVLSKPGPFVVGAHLTLELTYTVGELAMAEGGGIVVANNLHTRFQGRDPAADGYVGVRSSKGSARFERTEPWGRFGTFITRPAACFRLTEGTLEPGDTVTVILGDTSGGSRGMRVQLASNDSVVVPCYVDLEGAGQMLAPAWPGFRVVGEPGAAFVNGIVPSVVAPGEPFSLAVRTEDRYKNPVSGRTPAYRVLLDGEQVALVPPGDQPVAVVDGMRIGQPGVRRFEIRSQDGRLASRTNPVWVQERPGRRIYWGDTHGHIGLADGQGTADGYFWFGRDFARLDFLTLSEHDIWTDASEWSLLQSKAEQYLEPGRFTTFLGYEWTAMRAAGGHHNVYFRTTAGRQRVSHQEGIDLAGLYQGLRRVHQPEDVLIIPHAHMPGDWRKNDADMERVVEVQSGHGTFEFFGNRYLENGYFVGFVGSSDNHNTHPGYSPGTSFQLGGLAAVLAPANTREALFDALRDRACYATTGERIIFEATLDGVPMGQKVPTGGPRTLACRAHGTEPIDAIDVIKNGDVVYSKRYLAAGLSDRLRVMVRLGSSTDVAEYITPLAARVWSGSLEVKGARLVGFAPPWFSHPVTDSYSLDPKDPQRVVFTVATRGRSEGVLLELEGASEGAQIVVHLEDRADEPLTGARRLLQPGLEAELVFRIGDLVQGPALHELPKGDQINTVEAVLVPPDAALDQEFRYTDTTAGKPGDYYYLRVRQADGAVAWTSPWLIDKEK